MKNLIVLFMFCVGTFVFANTTDNLVDIVNTFRKKDASIAAAHFADNIEMDIPNHKGVFGSGQSKVILQQYLDANSPSNVNLSHSGSSAGGSKFAIVDFSANGSSKKAKVYFNSSNKIIEIKID